MAATTEWVLLAYRIPREPSTPRIAVWRKLRRLGAVQLLDGLVALPADARTKEHLEWIADDVIAADGEADLWIARPASRAQERALAVRMQVAVAEEYAAVVEEAEAAASESPASRRRTLARLRREVARIRDRDYFPGRATELAAGALAALGAVVDAEVMP